MACTLSTIGWLNFAYTFSFHSSNSRCFWRFADSSFSVKRSINSLASAWPCYIIVLSILVSYIYIYIYTAEEKPQFRSSSSHNWPPAFCAALPNSLRYCSILSAGFFPALFDKFCASSTDVSSTRAQSARELMNEWWKIYFMHDRCYLLCGRWQVRCIFTRKRIYTTATVATL